MTPSIWLADLPHTLRKSLQKGGKVGQPSTGPLRAKLAQAKAEARAVTFLRALDARHLPRPHREYRFHETRMWRWDFCWVDQMLALESDGVWGGAHNRGPRIVKDHEKRNAGVIAGYRVLVVASHLLCSDETLALVASAFEATPRPPRGRGGPACNAHA